MKTKNILRLVFLASGAAAVWLASDYCRTAMLRKQLEKELEDKEEPERLIGMPNPVRKLRPDEFCSKSGLGMDPEKLEDCRAYMINTEPVIYGLRLLDSDGLEYDLRCAGKDAEGDISGMYYEWTTVAEHPSEAPQCKVYLNDCGQGVCSWDDEKHIYTISMTEEASLVKLVWMRDKILSLMNKC